MPFLDEIAARLVSQGVGTTSGTSRNIFTSSQAIIPDGNGPYLTLIETGGSGPTRVHNQTGALTQRPTAQIYVRASTYVAARAMARLAYLALDGVFNTTLSGTFYQSVTVRQDITDLQADDLGRARVVFNIDAEKHPS
jgi:hypothetical protein